MIYFPNAKINLGLRVLGKRADGFHEISSLFIPTQWCDVLEVIARENGERGRFNLTCEGLEIECESDDNLVAKAHALISKDYDLPEIQAQLIKVIPSGAGLGGGSADGAFMLKAINDICKLGLTKEKLKSYASILGSDCPFFIENCASKVGGRGEVINNIDSHLDLSGVNILIIHPAIHINTKEAFSSIEHTTKYEGITFEEIKKLDELPLDAYATLLKNDFEAPILKKEKNIDKALDIIKRSGSKYSQMTGTGSAVFGLYRFHNNIEVNRAISEAKELGWTTYFGALS